MSGRHDRLRAIRLTAMICLLALASGGAAAQSPEAGKPSFLERLWSGIKGGGKPEEAPPAGADAADPAPSSLTPPSLTPPSLTPPSLARAQWIGFTPVLAVGAAEGAGAWIAGPFPEAGARGWVTDTVSGLTTPVRLVWREAEPGSLARLSAEAARGLGLAPGAVANVAIYLAR